MRRFKAKGKNKKGEAIEIISIKVEGRRPAMLLCSKDDNGERRSIPDMIEFMNSFDNWKDQVQYVEDGDFGPYYYFDTLVYEEI